jgi:hypothetical protein
MPRNYELSPYPIPDNHLPDDDTCWVVFVPNDPMYRAIFFAQWDELTKWLSWEKGESKRAREVAQRFKRRFPRPIACDVVDELDNEGNMTITVKTNVTCKCGGGCGGGCVGPYTPNFDGQDWTLDDVSGLPGVDEDFGDNYPDGFGDRQEYDDYKCQMSGQLVQDWIDSLTSMEILGAIGTGLGGAGLLAFFGAIGTATSGTTALSGIFATLMAIGLSAATAVYVLVGGLLATIAAGFISWQYFGQLATELAVQKGTLRCLLYNSTTADEARAILVSATNDTVTTLIQGDLEQGGFFQELIFTIIDVLVPNELIELLFKAGASLIRGDVQYECNSCVDSTPPQNGDFLYIYGSDNDGGVDEGDGGTGNYWLDADKIRVGGDDSQEEAWVGHHGNTINGGANQAYALAKVYIDVDDREVGLEGQTLEIWAKDFQSQLVMISTITAGDIPVNGVVANLTGFEIVAGSTGQEFKYVVKNLGYPDNNQGQQIIIKWVVFYI